MPIPTDLEQVIQTIRNNPSDPIKTYLALGPYWATLINNEARRLGVSVDEFLESLKGK